MPAGPRAHSQTITAILVDAGVVTDDQVQVGLTRQRETGRRIGETLVELGIVTEEDIAWALSRQLGLPFLDVQVDAVDADLVRSFPDLLLHRLEAVPLFRGERSLSVAVADPTDGEGLDALERAAGCVVNPGVATRSTIRSVLDTLLGPRRDHPATHAAVESGGHFDVVWDRSGSTFLLFHLSKALKVGATEVHFLPDGAELRVFHRVAGRLVPASVEPFETVYSLLARLSALGGPSIDDRDVHATGQVVCPLGERELRIDVSLLNHEAGIAVTLGLRPTGGVVPALEDLGIDPLAVASMRAVLDAPAGLVLVSGPVRSGCSTTLASLLSSLDLSTRRSVSFETRPGPRIPAGIRLALDPVRARACWEEIVRAQDVDVVVLADVLGGAEVHGALSSAGAGRLILASTDWTDSFALLEHLMSRAELRSVLASRLHLVVQQRLAHGLDREADGPAPPQRPLFEVLFVTDALRQAIRDGESQTRLRAIASADRFRSLADQAAVLVATQVLSATEAERILA